MKFQAAGHGLQPPQSPPSRGAWIEIEEGRDMSEWGEVAPLAGGVD